MLTEIPGEGTTTNIPKRSFASNIPKLKFQANNRDLPDGDITLSFSLAGRSLIEDVWIESSQEKSLQRIYPYLNMLGHAYAS